MSLLFRRSTMVSWLGFFLLASACDDEPRPASEAVIGNATQQDGGTEAGAPDAGGHDSGANLMDSGNLPATDGGAPRAEAGAPDSNVDGTAGSPGDAGTTSDAATTADAGSTDGGGAEGGGPFTVTSPAFDNRAGCSENMASSCDSFPDENVSYMQNAASETANISPELNWTGAPAGTQSFAVVLQDLTLGAVHWVLWNVPGTLTRLEKNISKSSARPAVPAGSQQCNTRFATGDGYFGPGSRCNVYEFVLYALAVPTFSPTPATDADQVRTQLQALGGEILGTASLRGRANYLMMCGD